MKKESVSDDSTEEVLMFVPTKFKYVNDLNVKKPSAYCILTLLNLSTFEPNTYYFIQVILGVG
jgi:hypothetical protein